MIFTTYMGVFISFVGGSISRMSGVRVATSEFISAMTDVDQPRGFCVIDSFGGSGSRRSVTLELESWGATGENELKIVRC